MADEIAGDLKAQQMPENPQRPAPQCFDRGLHDDEAAERQRNDQQQIPVGLRQRFVHDELQLKRRGECRDLQRDRQDAESGSTRPEIRADATKETTA